MGLGVAEVLRTLYKNYGKGLEVANELPLPIIVDMIYHGLKRETEQQLYPLWLVHVVVSKLTGQKEILSFEDMMGNVKTNITTSNKTKEEIIEKFKKLVDKDKSKEV